MGIKEEKTAEIPEAEIQEIEIPEAEIQEAEPTLDHIIAWVKSALETDALSEREKKLLAYRFGLEGSEPHTLEECGEKFGISRERVRQIESKALRKRLPRQRRSRALRDYLE